MRAGREEPPEVFRLRAFGGHTSASPTMRDHIFSSNSSGSTSTDRGTPTVARLARVSTFIVENRQSALPSETTSHGESAIASPESSAAARGGAKATRTESNIIGRTSRMMQAGGLWRQWFRFIWVGVSVTGIISTPIGHATTRGSRIGSESGNELNRVSLQVLNCARLQKKVRDRT